VSLWSNKPPVRTAQVAVLLARRCGWKRLRMPRCRAKAFGGWLPSGKGYCAQVFRLVERPRSRRNAGKGARVSERAPRMWVPLRAPDADSSGRSGPSED
jgi:hypothetical protein